MTFLDELKAQTTVGTTQNGAKTYTSTLNANMDFFAQAGAMRGRLEDVRLLFAKAYSEDPELALRNLVHLRNIRLGGLGERSVYLEAFKYLVDGREKNMKVVTVFMDYMAYVGRWSDLIDIIEYGIKRDVEFVVHYGTIVIANQLTKDLHSYRAEGNVSLLAKWLPNVSTKNNRKRRLAISIANRLGYNTSSELRNYRKMIALLRDYLNVIEVRLASRDYGKIDLNQVPSRALFKYRKALQTHMPEEYKELLHKVETGEGKLNASNMLPHEIVRAYTSHNSDYVEDRALEATWNSLDDTLGGIEDNAIVVADTSGSMQWGFTSGVVPWYVAEGLAIYTAERLTGAFKNNFIVFSEKPYLVSLPTESTLVDKLHLYARHGKNALNTNLQSVFNLILQTAKVAHTPQSELPSKIIIISDMEWDEANPTKTNYELAKQKFEEAGYELPTVVFWNVYSTQDNLPVRFDEHGTALVSGYSTNILKQVLGKQITTPEQLMLNTLNVEQYDFVKEALI